MVVVSKVVMMAGHDNLSLILVFPLGDTEELIDLFGKNLHTPGDFYQFFSWLINKNVKSPKLLISTFL